MRPQYSIGYTLDDDLQVVTECRAYVGDGREELNEDLHTVFDGICKKHHERYKFIDGALWNVDYLDQ